MFDFHSSAHLGRHVHKPQRPAHRESFGASAESGNIQSPLLEADNFEDVEFVIRFSHKLFNTMTYHFALN